MHSTTTEVIEIRHAYDSTATRLWQKIDTFIFSFVELEAGACDMW